MLRCGACKGRWGPEHVCGESHDVENTDPVCGGSKRRNIVAREDEVPLRRVAPAKPSSSQSSRRTDSQTAAVQIADYGKNNGMIERLAAVLEMDIGAAQAVVRKLTEQEQALGGPIDQQKLRRRCIVSVLHKSGRTDWKCNIDILSCLTTMVGMARLAGLQKEYDSVLH